MTEIEKKLGRAELPSEVPAAAITNPKTGAITNATFQGVDSDGRVVFSQDTSNKGQEEAFAYYQHYDQLENEFEKILRFSKIENQDDVAEAAEAYGPLFGTKYLENGVYREPVDMWLMAAKLFRLGVNVKSAYDSKNWKQLQDCGEVEFSLTANLSPSQVRELEKKGKVNFHEKQPCSFSAEAPLHHIPEGYLELTLSDKELRNGEFRSERWDKPGLEIKSYIGKPKLGQTPIPSLKSTIFLYMMNQEEDIGGAGQNEPMSLEDCANKDLLCVKLCNLLLELLISVHTRSMNYDWVNHSFRPVAQTLIQYMWYEFALYNSKEQFSFCEYCGKPYMRSNKNGSKYCSDRCRKAANRGAKKPKKS